MNLQKFAAMLPPSVRDQVILKLFGLFQVPLIFYVRPKILEASENNCEVLIPLNRRTQNHLKCMYFGVLCTGADVAGGYLAMKAIVESGKKVQLIFKDFNARFLKRAQADVIFKCHQGIEMKSLVNLAIESGERVEKKISISAFCNSECVAEFELTLSLKLKS